MFWKMMCFGGFIFKAHGLKGELIIKAEQNLIEDIQNLELVFLLIEGKPVPFFIQSEFSRWKSNDQLFVKLKGIDSVEHATSLLSTPVHIPVRYIEDLENDDDNFIYFNYKLHDKNGTFVGTIIDWMDIQHNPVLTIDRQGNELLLPFVEDWIMDIDDDNKILQMDFPEDLLHL
jgi:16S rRNA processing protein RimM